MTRTWIVAPLRLGGYLLLGATITGRLDPHAVLLIVLAIAAIGAVRALRSSMPRVTRSVAVAISAGASLCAVALTTALALESSWWGVAVIVAWTAAEVAIGRVPAELWKRLPEAAVRPPVESVAAVVLGALIAGAGAGIGGPVPYRLLLLTVPAGCVALFDYDLERWNAIRSPVALIGCTLAAAAAVSGFATGLSVENALLGSMAGILVTAFAWVSLVDPRPEERERRVALLARSAALALCYGTALLLALAG